MIAKIRRFREQGFTLVEMAMVLLIVALLLGGLVPTLSGQIEQRRNSETSKQLDEIREALIGYAIINGRLPCPASSISNGIEDPQNTGICNHPYDGFVPAATLGISSTVDSLGNTGFSVDSWGNRIHYAVTKSNSYAFTKPSGSGGIKMVGISSLSPDLFVCSTATGIAGLPPTCSSGPPSTALTTGVPAVIYSTGKNGGYGGTGADEKQNPNPNSTNNDRVFVSHTPTPSPNEFDDLVIWISPNTLINRMVAAGQLP